MGKKSDVIQKARERLLRAIRDHGSATVVNLEYALNDHSAHAAAVCDALRGVVSAFPKRMIYVVLEAEISALGCRARPEDLVAWIEDVGVFVVEVKSHTIKGIRSFQNGVPQVAYRGEVHADKDLIEQPKDFAYKLSGQLSRLFDDDDDKAPALYFAGWLPNVSLMDVTNEGFSVRQNVVWLSDMCDPDYFLAQLPSMKNLTRGTGASREQLDRFAGVFGCTSGLRKEPRYEPATPGTLGYQIDQRERQISILTKEQEALARHPHIVNGPKVVRGVVGSGKTVVLTNAVAEQYLRARESSPQGSLFDHQSGSPKILVLCYNRVLAPYLKKQIAQCFEARKPRQEWKLPSSLTVVSIDRLAYRVAKATDVDYSPKRAKEDLSLELVEAGIPEAHAYDHIFIDEAQDLDLGWYPFIRAMAKPGENGPSIVLFYDEAQNVYGTLRPGAGAEKTWTDLLGAKPVSMGISTVMRVGHRNTNEILTFSFSMLLGSFASRDPQTVQYTNLADYKNRKVPEDPALDHPRAGQPCVEQVGPRQYTINFAVWSGPPPSVRCVPRSEHLVAELVKQVRREIREENVRPSDILVMTPDRAEMEELVAAFDDADVPTHCPIGPKDKRDQPLFQDGKITVCTIFQAKGFTAHVVHVAFIESLEARGGKNEKKARAELHVACTRATLRLSLWSTGGRLIEEAQDALQSGC